MATEPQSPLEPLKTGRFAGRVAFAQLIRDSLAAAAAQDWNQLILCDASFEDWPLNERAVIDSLNAWARGGRTFTIVATQYDSIVRLHPRFVTWRRTWGHIVDSRICRQIDPAISRPCWWSPQWVLQRLDPVRASGVTGAEPERVVQGRELLQELLQVSSPGFPATTLGL